MTWEELGALIVARVSASDLVILAGFLLVWRLVVVTRQIPRETIELVIKLVFVISVMLLGIRAAELYLGSLP